MELWLKKLGCHYFTSFGSLVYNPMVDTAYMVFNKHIWYHAVERLWTALPSDYIALKVIIDTYDFYFLVAEDGLYEPIEAGSHFIFLSHFIAVFGLIFLLLLVVFFVSPQKFSLEKQSSYECGFEPFGDARTAFDIHFYIVGILFLIFDLEVVFLFPWLFSIVENPGLLTQLTMTTTVVFLVLLGLGFIYEWVKNALIWVPIRVIS